ncbi:hypothetical protein D3C76_1204930 [compost metagenome]
MPSVSGLSAPFFSGLVAKATPPTSFLNTFPAKWKLMSELIFGNSGNDSGLYDLKVGLPRLLFTVRASPSTISVASLASSLRT